MRWRPIPMAPSPLARRDSGRAPSRRLGDGSRHGLILDLACTTRIGPRRASVPTTRLDDERRREPGRRPPRDRPGVFAWVQPDGRGGSTTPERSLPSARRHASGRHGDRRHVRDVRADPAVPRRRRCGHRAAPIAMAVNTHQHGDHTYGNSVLPPRDRDHRAPAMRAGLLADTIIDGCPPVWSPVPEWGPVSSRVPSIAVDDRLTVYAGSRVDRLHHPGYAAHTTGDLVAWLPGERVLFSGDLIFHGLTPLVLMGSRRRAPGDHSSGWRRSTPSCSCRATAAGRRRVDRRRARRPRPLLPVRRVRRSRDVGDGLARWRRHGGATSASSPPGPTPSGSCSTSTVPTPTPRAATSTCSQR